jgi:hypothetical protein
MRFLNELKQTLPGFDQLLFQPRIYFHLLLETHAPKELSAVKLLTRVRRNFSSNLDCHEDIRSFHQPLKVHSRTSEIGHDSFLPLTFQFINPITIWYCWDTERFVKVNDEIKELLHADRNILSLFVSCLHLKYNSQQYYNIQLFIYFLLVWYRVYKVALADQDAKHKTKN